MSKVYAIVEQKRRARACAYLTYDRATDEYHIVISDWATPDDLPFLLSLLLEKTGNRAIDPKWARRWVEERVPPPSRQNLGAILKANGLTEYDPFALLVAARGQSAQDDFIIRECPAREAFQSCASTFGAPEQLTYQFVALDANAQDDAEKPTQSESLARIAGREIANARKRYGLTQVDLAKRTGIDQAVLSRIESGRANPTLGLLEDVAAAMGLSIKIEISDSE